MSESSEFVMLWMADLRMKLEGRRMRSDSVETFKIVNGKYDIIPE